MSTFVRFDEDHFGYLLDRSVHLSPQMAQEFGVRFEKAWPGRKLIVIQADTFEDLTGQYEILPLPVDPASTPDD